MPVPALLAAAIPAIGGLIGAGIAGGTSYAGQREANRTNIRLAREQMAFQERMSNTSYQRAVEDMRMAGINPMLAYQQGGASSPGGASARVESALGPAVSSAMHAFRLRQELENMKRQNELLRAQTRKADNEATLTYSLQRKAATEANQLEFMSPYLKTMYENLSKVERSKIGELGRWAAPIGNIFNGTPLGLIPKAVIPRR